MQDYDGNEHVCPSCGDGDDFSVNVKEEVLIYRYGYASLISVDTDGYMDDVDYVEDYTDEEHIETVDSQWESIHCNSCGWEGSALDRADDDESREDPIDIRRDLGMSTGSTRTGDAKLVSAAGMIMKGKQMDAALRIDECEGFEEYEIEPKSKDAFKRAQFYLGKMLVKSGFESSWGPGEISFRAWNVAGCYWNEDGELDLDSDYLAATVRVHVVMELRDSDGNVVKELYFMTTPESVLKHEGGKIASNEIEVLIYEPLSIQKEHFDPEDVEKLEFYKSELGLLAQTLEVVFDVHPEKGWMTSGVIAA